MRKQIFFAYAAMVVYLFSSEVVAQAVPDPVVFEVSVKPAENLFSVRMDIARHKVDTLELRMPAWTPGYYQLLNFADHVQSFSAKGKGGKDLPVIKSGKNGWKIRVASNSPVTVYYEVKATRSFVATPFVDSTRAYIVPTGVFMYEPGKISRPAKVKLNMPKGWTAATGLKPIKKDGIEFLASDFDVLFDSPILTGPLEALPPFRVKNIPHEFIAYKPGNFSRDTFMRDISKIVAEASETIGDIPYDHYTFIGIGSGPGGIEHLNSTTFGFNGSGLSTPDGRKRMYTFLAHEYFHHYNVKRIRPVELGPFDYDKENKTTMLWVSEGITVYYDQLIVFRAGLMTLEDLLNGYRDRLLGYENKPGRLFQSATEASYNTWSDGPFGRQDDEFNKTVSVYDKGAVLGLMLDFNIRSVTKNAKSLDDVMRRLYNEFYLEKKRGFTPEEFQQVCEDIAGQPLTEIFNYAATTQPIDYKKYFNLGGLDIDTLPKKVPGAWLGISTRLQHDTLLVSNVDYLSPAWNAGIRRRMIISAINNEDPKKTGLSFILKDQQAGQKLNVQINQNGSDKNFEIITAEKIEPDFKVTLLENPDLLQKEILESWTKPYVKH